jgi:methionyl-tRNA formyltransferase
MRIALMGNSSVFSAAIFEHVAAQPDLEVVAIVSPPRRRGVSAVDRCVEAVRRVIAYMGARLPNGLYKRFWQDRDRFLVGIERVRRKTRAHFCTQRANDLSVVSLLGNLRPEVVVVAGLNEILKGKLLSRLPWTVNVHPSLLPDFRGPSPFFWILSHGKTTSGVTLHLVDESIDTGDVIAQRSFDIEPWLTCGELRSRSVNVGGHLLVETLRAWKNEPPARFHQQGTGSYFRNPSPEDLVVPFNANARTVFDRARAATPDSGLFLWVPEDFLRAQVACSTRALSASAEGYLMLELSDAVPLYDIELGEPGVVRRTESGAVAIACRSGTVVFRRSRPLSSKL